MSLQYTCLRCANSTAW